MGNHYHDPEMDDCPLHKDSETDQFFKLELVMPIGLSKPHGSWKASAHWAIKLMDKINPLLETDEKEALEFRMGVGHSGIHDHKSCMKYLMGEEIEE